MTTLLIGGTGKTGTRVADRLTSMGHRVRIGSRTSHTRFDWSERATWAPALAGCTASYITYQPDLAAPGASEAVDQLTTTALAEGVTRLVLLSGRGEEAALRAEEALQASGAEWTIVRCAFFFQNFSESVWVDSIAAGELSMVRHGAGEPFVDADDIADVVVAALTEPGHEHQVYELTGPRLLTFGTVADEIARVTGRPIVYRELDTEELGLPQGWVTSDLWCREVPLEGCVLCPSRTPRSSATTSCGLLATVSPVSTSSRSLPTSVSASPA